MFDLQRFTLPNFGLMIKSDKEKLDAINTDTILTKTEASDTYVTKSAMAEYVADIVPNSNGFIAYDGNGNIVCNAVIDQGGGTSTDNSPNLKISNTVIIPNTITAVYNGGGQMSVSLQNDIADYTVQGNQVIFDLKDEHDTGTFTSDALIIIGANGDYQSDCADFIISATYDTLTSTKRVPHVSYHPHLYSLADTIGWNGGELSIAEVGSNFTAALGDCSVNGVNKRRPVYYTFTGSLNAGECASDTVKLHISGDSHYDSLDVVQTITAYARGGQVTLTGGSNDVNGLTVVLANNVSSLRNQSFTNYGKFCSINTGGGVDTIVNYGEGAIVTLGGDSPDSVCNYADGVCIDNRSVWSLQADSHGDYCTIFGGQYATMKSTGASCSLRCIGGNAEIYSDGDNCEISATRSAITLSAGSANSTINATSSAVYCNDNDIVFYNRSPNSYQTVYDIGDKSTIVVSTVAGCSASDGNYWIGGTNHGTTFVGKAQNSFTIVWGV